MNEDVGKNVWYTSVSTIIISSMTYLFWFVTAKFSGPEAIGLASAIASFVTIVTTVNGLNISIGMKRNVGIAIAAKNMRLFKQIFTAVILFVSIGITISIFLISIPQLSILETLGMKYQYIWIIVPMIIAQAFQYVFSESLVASRNSKKLVLPVIIGSFIRFPIFFVALFLVDVKSIGIVVAYASLLIASTTYYGIYFIRTFKGISAKAIENFGSNMRQLLKPSLVSWIPQIISVLGSQLGILAVFVIKGASEGGKFYIPMAVFLATLFIVTSINRVAHSQIAGIENKEHQIRFVSYAMRIAFLFTIPISTSILFFAGNFLNILGGDFNSASNALIILMCSMPFMIISEMIYYFSYGKGDNKSVLYLGLTGNISRTILYLILIPVYGSNGAAVAFFTGTVIQAIFSIILSRKYSVVIEYKKYIILTLIPLLLGAILWQSQIHFIISAIVIFFISLLIYVKLRLFTEDDLHNVLLASLPKNTAQNVYHILIKIMRKI